jgi:hypothetical protein
MSRTKVFRVRWQIKGVHVHIRIFVGSRGSTLALCGELVMTEDEFIAFRRTVEDQNFKFGAEEKSEIT